MRTASPFCVLPMCNPLGWESTIVGGRRRYHGGKGSAKNFLDGIRQRSPGEKEKGRWVCPSGLRKLSRRRPTFPRSYPRSIIGDAELNCRVRNGNGCDLRSMTTGNLSSGVREKLNTGWDARCRKHQIKANMVKSNDRLVLVSSRRCRPYTPSLSTWSSTTGLQGELILW